MNTFFKDIRSMASLGVPLVIAQLCLMAMALTDAIMVGRGVGTEALAAMALGLSFVNVPFIALYGFSSAPRILTARAFGSGKTAELPVILRHGIFLSAASAVVVGAGTLWFFNHLEWVNYLGQPPELIPIARPYLYFYTAAFLFMLCGGNLRAYCESQNRAWLPLYVILGSIVANAVLDYAFIYGVFGLPKMGLPGAGMATLLCSFGQFVVLLTVVLKSNLHLTFRELVRPAILRDFTARHLRLGIPTALQIGVEIGAMSIVAMFAGMVSASTLAAHHVTMQVASFSFMVPMGMSFAVSIRVSQAAGANDRARVISIARSGLTFAACWMGGMTILLVGLHSVIPWAFTRDPEVAAMAASFLVVAGLFQVFDGVQCTSIGALRGLKDVNAPTLIVTLIYWVFEIPVSWLLCFKAGLGGLGVWIALFLGLILSATFLTSRLRRVAASKVLTD